jgi:hypothetical protein
LVRLRSWTWLPPRTIGGERRVRATVIGRARTGFSAADSRCVGVLTLRADGQRSDRHSVTSMTVGEGRSGARLRPQQGRVVKESVMMFNPDTTAMIAAQHGAELQRNADEARLIKQAELAVRKSSRRPLSAGRVLHPLRQWLAGVFTSRNARPA